LIQTAKAKSSTDAANSQAKNRIEKATPVKTKKPKNDARYLDFEASRRPTSRDLQMCPACNHSFVNYEKTNKEYEDDLKARDSEYTKKLSSSNAGEKKVRKQAVKRMIKCFCQNINCLLQADGCNCMICKQDGPMIDHSTRSCLCEICCCDCDARFSEEQVPKLAREAAQRSNISTSSTGTLTPSTKATSCTTSSGFPLPFSPSQLNSATAPWYDLYNSKSEKLVRDEGISKLIAEEDDDFDSSGACISTSNIPPMNKEEMKGFQSLLGAPTPFLQSGESIRSFEQSGNEGSRFSRNNLKAQVSPDSSLASDITRALSNEIMDAKAGKLDLSNEEIKARKKLLVSLTDTLSSSYKLLLSADRSRQVNEIIDFLIDMNE